MNMYLIVIAGVGYLTSSLTWTTDRNQAARWPAEDADAVLTRYTQAFRCPA